MPESWCQGAGARELVPGSWCQGAGARELVPGSWCQGAGARELVPGSWCQGAGARELVPGSWCQGAGARELVPGSWLGSISNSQGKRSCRGGNQWVIAPPPPSLTLRKASASGTAASEISIRSQNASIYPRNDACACTCCPIHWMAC